MSTNNFYATIKSMEDIFRNGISKLTVNDAFQEITNLLLLKLIESDIKNGKFKITNKDSIEIDEECRLDIIYEKYCENYDLKIKNKDIIKGDLFKLLYDEKRHLDIYYDEQLDATIERDNEENYNNLCVFKKIFHHKTLSDVYSGSWKKYFKFEESHEPDIVKCIIKLHEGFNMSLNKSNSDLLGDAFEKYRDGVFGSKSGLGQYFTSQYIIEKILNEVELKPTDTLFDSSCGAGGFFIKARQYIKNKYGNVDDFCKNNVFGYEVDPNIFKVLQVNAYIYGFSFNNFQLCDSITDKSTYQTKKYDVLAYNPPFGASFDVKDPKIFPINIKNSVCLFLQLGFNALKENGRCGVVVDQGIINNGTEKKTTWQSKIRKELLKNGLKKIILLPNGAFQYTNFAICIIIYDRTYKNKKIIFEEGYFSKEDKGTRIKPMYFKKIGEITYEQCEKNNYSLKTDDYFKVEDVVKQDTSGWLKLGDVCEILTKSKHKAGDAINNGLYNFYTSSSIIKKSNFNDYPNESIIIGSGGNGSLFLDKNFSCSSHNFILSCSINIKFVYYFLKINFNKLYNLYKGGGLKNLSQVDLKNFLIPNLSESHQEEIVKFLDEIYEHAKIEDTLKYLKDKPIFNTLINRNYDDFKNIIFYQDNIKQLLFELSNIPKKKNLQIKSIFNSYQSVCENKKLGDIVEIKKGNFNSGDMNNNGTIPFYTTSVNSPVGTHDNYTLDELEYIIFAKDGGNKTNPLSLTSGIAKSWYVQGKTAFASHSIAFIPTNIKCKYLYYYLTFYRTKLMSKAKYGSGLGYISLKDINEFKIPVPSLEIQEEIIKRIESLEEPSSHYNQYAKILETELNNINEIISNMTILNNNINDELDNDQCDNNNNDIDEKESINEEVLIEEDLIEDEEQLIEDEEIEYKGKTYFLNNDNAYIKLDDGSKGPIYGTYKNGKVKKIKITEITI